MKKSRFYLIVVSVAIVAAVTSISIVGMNSGFSSMFEADFGPGEMPEDMTTAPKSVTDTISELEEHRSHLSETCIYGAAMVLNDLGNEAQQVINDESKCIHALVISIIRERKLKFEAERRVQMNIDQENQNSAKTSLSKTAPSESERVSNPSIQIQLKSNKPK